MAHQTNADGDDAVDGVFASLASGERRRVLEVAMARDPEPASTAELATALAAWRTDEPRTDVTDQAREQAAVSLHHVHLPKLTAAGLLDRVSDDAVAPADHPAYDDPGVREVIVGDVTADADELDALFKSLADERRRTVLDVLSHQIGSVHTETLARELLARERDTVESDVPVPAVEQCLTRLRHADLPRLSAAGLIDYDADARTVAYEGHPQLSVPWMHSVLHSAFRGSLTGESEPDGIGEIEGRERVISFGQSLCDRADEELFCMFTDTQLLEAGCLTRIRDASRRGVDVYLGTPNPAVREYVRENAPEVVLWEPNTDWLNLPVAGDRVGRLLLADREAVMLGTLLEERTDGYHDEQAIVGEGEHNTLVTMICQLLGPHLEKIDAGTPDAALDLPL